MAALSVDNAIGGTKTGRPSRSPRAAKSRRSRLFADTLAEEATLGLVNPDGSLSKNLTPFTLPPAAEEKKSADKAAPAAPADEPKPDPPPQDATTADRGPPPSRLKRGVRYFDAGAALTRRPSWMRAALPSAGAGTSGADSDSPAGRSNSDCTTASLS